MAAAEQTFANAGTARRSPATWLYASTIFLGAFLLFLLEPLMAKLILPWFGGSAAVWTTCLVFFQVVLLLGYLYAHGTTRRLGARQQATLHIALLAASVALLRIQPSASWAVKGNEDPGWRILLALTGSIGLPYFLLSSTGPLLQAWHAREGAGAFPYRLFALSNLASLLALLGYPLLLEPYAPTRTQASGWSVGYAAFAALCGWAAWRSRDGEIRRETAEEAGAPTRAQQILWLALAACGSILLLAITNYLCQDIAAIPFLWVLPLALYLLTFILCFKGRGWHRQALFARMLAVALASMAYYIVTIDHEAIVQLGLPLFLSGLFICCMFCHGELALRKPAARHLTSFYLMISCGGALGAVLVGVVTPHVFKAMYELPAALLITAILATLVMWRQGWATRSIGAAITAGTAAVVVMQVQSAHRQAIVMERNFYGALRVVESGGPDPSTKIRTLYHGTINHGAQFEAPNLREKATTYYGPESGAGLALRFGCPPGCKVGVIGLGTGTLATYGRAGDTYEFYEINPLAPRLAREQFTYLSDSKAKINIVMGDARLSLARQEPQGFDVLLVDAFSGDAIPVHLLTREACELYFRHLKPDGILGFHISNKYLNLAPVVEQFSRVFDRPARLYMDEDNNAEDIAQSDWVLLSSRFGLFDEPQFHRLGLPVPAQPGLRPWTDDYNNLLQIVRWTGQPARAD